MAMALIRLFVSDMNASSELLQYQYRLLYVHTPSVAFRHLPPNSARFSYATEGALFISAQLSTDAVSALRKVSVLIKLWKQPSAQLVSRFGLAVRR